MIPSLHRSLARGLTALAPEALPFLARAVFAGVLLAFFWQSGLTKLGPSIFTPSDGAYIQIFPRAVEAAGYDFAQLTFFHRLVVLAGTWAEFALPALIVLGLLTRLAAAGMIGFVVVMSLTDVLGHGVGGETLGAWFDRDPAALLLDQRALWIVLLAVPLFLGPGRLSLDRALGLDGGPALRKA